MTPRIFLRAREEMELKQGFPWVFDNEVESVRYDASDGSGVKTVPLSDSALDSEVPDGSVVEVFARAGGFLGTGVLNRKSRISVRIVAHEHADRFLSDVQGFFDARIQSAFDLRRLSFSDEDSYRLVYGEADFIPGLIVERYRDTEGRVYLVVQFSTLSCEAFRKEIFRSLRKAVRPYGVYERSDSPTREREGLPLRSCWEGEVRQERITIRENGVLLEVDLARGQKTGYFLDQKDNRAAVAALSNGRRVLDTFSHTGAFGLNALRGGASEVVCADISEEAVALVRRNAELNGAGGKLAAVQADVFALLKEYEEKGERFDMIILDPPAFTKSARNIQKAYGGYKEINLRAMRILNPNGILVTCSCSYFFDPERFYGMLMKAAEDAGRRVQVIRKGGAGADHPVLLGYPKSDYLKCAVCRVV